MNTHLDDDTYGIKGIRSATPRNRGLKAALLIITALSVFVTLGLTARSVHRPVLAQATATKVAPKATGQAQALPATNGNEIEKEQLLVSDQEPEVQARLEEARTALELAKERNKRIQAACAEYICAQSNWWVITKSVAERAEQTVARARASQAAQVISLQELQDLEGGLDWARSCERAAKASFELAVTLVSNEGDLAASADFEPVPRRGAELEALLAELATTTSRPRVTTPEP